MNADNFQIEIFLNLDDIVQRWSSLESCGVATPFQSLIWCKALYEHIGRGRGAVPCIIVVRDRRSGNDALLFPFWLYNDEGGRRRISFFDMGFSDYAAPVMASKNAVDTADMRLIWPLILKKLPAADYLHISKIAEKIGDMHNPLLDIAPARMVDMKSWDMELPGEWADYRLKILSTRSRKNLDQKWRKLRAAGEPIFIHGANAHDAERFFTVLLRQRRARFAALGREEILECEDHAAFYRQMLLQPDTPAIITALSVENEIISVLYGLIYGNTYYMLLSSFEADGWGQYSPGLLIVEAMMEWLHGCGVKVYDFTIGSEPYKQKLGGSGHKMYEHMQPFSLHGRYLAGTSNAKRTIKALLRQPPG